MDNAAGFSRQWNARLASETKIMDILKETPFSHLYSDFRRANVGRLADNLLDRESPVRFVVVQLRAEVIKMAMLAIEDIRESDRGIIERPGNHNNLESRSRLWRIGDHAVSPRLH